MEPDIGGDDRNGVILVDNEGQSIRECVDRGRDAQGRALGSAQRRRRGEGANEEKMSHSLIIRLNGDGCRGRVQGVVQGKGPATATTTAVPLGSRRWADYNYGLRPGSSVGRAAD